jgi:uncharacterized membrane protein
MGRIALGLIFGAAIMSFGWVRMGKFIAQGSIFLALGTAVVLLTTFAARVEYDFFTPASSLLIMFLAVLFSAVASLKSRQEWLAWMSVISAYIIPLLTVSHEVHEIEFFTYLFLVTIGVLWLIFFTDWRRIFIAALVAVTMYSFPYWVSGYVVEGGLLIYGYLFVGLFFLANLVGFLSLPKERSAHIEIFGAIWNAVILSGWTHVGIGDEWQSLVFAIWAVVFLVGAFFFSVRAKMQAPFFVYAGVGVILIGIATALELDGPALTIAFLIESTVAIIFAHLLSTSNHFRIAAVCTYIVPLLLSFESIASFPTYPREVFTDDMAVVFLTLLSLIAIAAMSRTRELPTSDRVTTARFFSAVSGFYAFLFVWLFLHAIFPSDTATQISLFLSMIIGVGLYVHYQHSELSNERVLRFAGLLLVLFVIGHLLLIEIWDMDIVPRIITFFVIGGLLMSTAFMKKLKKY